tara:strand:+ start:5092 stop:5340 length:249 start_codon:yes stop_codon:yes gene_type:complete
MAGVFPVKIPESWPVSAAPINSSAIRLSEVKLSTIPGYNEAAISTGPKSVPSGVMIRPVVSGIEKRMSNAESIGAARERLRR